VQAQYGESVGGSRLVDCCRSRNDTNRNVEKILAKIRLEGEENNMIVSLRSSIVECTRGSYSKAFVGKVRDFVPI